MAKNSTGGEDGKNCVEHCSRYVRKTGLDSAVSFLLSPCYPFFWIHRAPERKETIIVPLPAIRQAYSSPKFASFHPPKEAHNPCVPDRDTLGCVEHGTRAHADHPTKVK